MYCFQWNLVYLYITFSYFSLLQFFALWYGTYKLYIYLYYTYTYIVYTYQAKTGEYTRESVEKTEESTCCSQPELETTVVDTIAINSTKLSEVKFKI